VSARTPAYSWYVLAVLLAVYVMNFVDRQILSIVLDDVKAELGASDTAMGLLSGLAFSLFYSVAGVPIARLADRGTRRSIVAAGLALWSAMTAACGLAGSFWQLALARFGVGVGEAAGTPPSHSLISDYFPPDRRATALAIYGMGIYFGVMFGFLAGGMIRDAFDWRTAFLAAALPGLPLALLLRFTVREPVRGAAEARVVGAEPPPLDETLRALFGQRSFVMLTLAACCQAVSGYAVLTWGAPFLGRVHGLSGTEIGTSFGLVAGLGGALGITSGGYLADRLARRDPRFHAWLPAAVSLLAFPFALPFYLADDTSVALASFAGFYVINNMYVGSLWSLAQGLVPVRVRALASAALLTVLNIVGQGLGPLFVGVMNDALAPTQGVDAIRYSLLVTAAVGACAAPFFVLCARRLREDLSAASGDGVN
jgi:predicted MFS family arabinose efflux permease